MAKATDTTSSSVRARNGSHGLTDWRCRCCGALLGRYLDQRMQICFARGHDYFVTLPVTTRCRRCQQLNELARQTAG